MTNKLYPVTGFQFDSQGNPVNIIDQGLRANVAYANGLQPVVDAHTRIHMGDMFTVCTADATFDDNIAQGDFLDLIIVPDEDSFPHIVFSYKTNNAGKFYVYELASSSSINGGTSISTPNKKYNSSKTFRATAIRNPTNAATTLLSGAVLKEAETIPGYNQGQQHQGEEHGFNSEIIVGPKPILFRIHNTNNASMKASIRLLAYNANAIVDS
jgi:hypothetical protein